MTTIPTKKAAYFTHGKKNKLEVSRCSLLINGYLVFPCTFCLSLWESRFYKWVHMHTQTHNDVYIRTYTHKMLYRESI